MDTMKLTIPCVRIRIFGFILCISVGLALFFSAVYSGYRYMYDYDELSHVNMMYLLSSGYRPFLDFFSIYAPLFHYALLPVFTRIGATMNVFPVFRLVMIGMWIIRLGVGWYFVSRLFSKPVAWIFVAVMLLDPFAVFGGMQIRPDNLMILVFTLGFALSFEAYMRKSKYLFLGAGFLMGLSVLVMLKIAVSAGVLSFLLFISFITKKRIMEFIFFAAGAIISVVLFCFFFLFQGSLVQMVIQLVFDSKAVMTGIWYPPPLEFFYRPDNQYLYGLPGRPVTWYIALVFPVCALGGMFYALFRWRKTETKRFWIIILASMLCIQCAFFLVSKTVFIQYFLAVNWIIAIFAAVFIHSLVTGIRKPVWLTHILSVLAIGVFLTASFGSIRANIARGAFTHSEAEEQILLRRWEIIDKQSSVYPYLLFRPLSQPILYGYFIPQVPPSIRSRYPTDLATVQKSDVRYLILSSYHLRFIDSETQAYIQDHFTQQSFDEELWIQNGL